MSDPLHQNQVEEESVPRRVTASWRSCLLLLVMLLGVLATPVAVIYRWYSDRAETVVSSSGESSGSVDRIAFITLDHQLATMDPDGRNVRRLTNLNQRFEFPAWSPDGSQVAVIAGERIYLVDDIDATPARDRLTELYASAEETPFYLYWSPDSRFVSFLANHAEGIALNLAEPQHETPRVRTLAVGQPFYWDWAPGADLLFIHSGSSGPEARLEMIDLTGSSADRDFGVPGLFQAPGISKDGQFRAFAELDGEGRSRLAVQSADGERVTYKTHVGQLAMTWSPTGDLLAYTSPKSESGIGGPLWLLDPAREESTLLSQQTVLAFFWSPDGRTIAFFTLPQEDNRSIQVAQSGDKRQILARAHRQTSELRLELWAVDVGSGNQRRLARFVPTGLFLRQFLPYFDQYSLSHRLWSPGGDALVIPVVESGRSQIAVVPLNRSSVKLIADGEIGFWSHQ